MISTGTKTRGSMNGATSCGWRRRCRRCFATIVALDAWNELAVSQHGRLLAAALLRQGGIASGAHLLAVNLGLKTISVDRRRHGDRDTRLLSIAQGLLPAAEIGLKENDRLGLAHTMIERKSSKLPELVEVVTQKPLVSAGMVAETRRHAAGGAADRAGAQASRDDGEGEVSGMGNHVALEPPSRMGETPDSLECAA